MVITYQIRNNLYINITNLCSNKCVFCIRDFPQPEPFRSLYLEREPTFEEITNAVAANNLDKFDEIVFCGYGEPTCRLYDMLETCKRIRLMTQTPIRVNTNGHSSLIMRENTAPLFAGLVDVVSISLNAADPETYNEICRPKFGEDAFTGVLQFAREIQNYVPKVILTAINGTIPPEDIQRCRDIAHSIGAAFRLRERM